MMLIAFAVTSCDLREARLKDFDKERWIQVALGTPLPSGITELQGIHESDLVYVWTGGSHSSGPFPVNHEAE